MSWRVPAEIEPQARVWMAFPTGNSHVADSPEAADRARTAWARVAPTTTEFEPVTMVADPVFSGGGGIHCVTQQQPGTSGRGQ